MAKMTRERLTEIEDERGHSPTLDEIAAIAEALGMPAWKLLKLAEDWQTEDQPNRTSPA